VTFAHPWWFAGGTAVLALAVGYWLAHRRRVRHTVRFANLALLRSVAPRRPGRWRHLPFAVMLSSLAVLTVALAGPTAQVRVPRNEATVMLAIDTSLSMQAADVSPNRLVAAQQAATQFVDDLTPGVNLGIVSFAGIASVLVSPTTDREAAKQAISGLQLDERTATGEAVISALQAIEVFSRTLGPGAATAGSDGGTGSAGPQPAGTSPRPAAGPPTHSRPAPASRPASC
jgi:Ca-activated chloride channel family protein